MARFGGNRRTDADRPGPDRPGGGGTTPVTYDPAVAAARAPHHLGDRLLITMSGIRQPIVAILLLISIFTVISGKPVDGLLLFTVATALAWDAGLHARQIAAARAAGASLEASEPPAPSIWKPRTGLPRLRFLAIGSAAAVIYALTVGSFSRYSWPTTAGVVGLGAGVVIIGWGGPTRQRVMPAKFARAGVITWSTLLVAAGLWELSALLQQPNIETSSYAHPTISTLTDPLLATAPGRAVALLGWIALGAYLVER
jgi:hypothetical protein